MPPEKFESIELIVGRIEGSLSNVVLTVGRLQNDVKDLELRFAKISADDQSLSRRIQYALQEDTSFLDNKIQQKIQEHEANRPEEARKKIQWALSIISVIISILLGIVVFFKEVKPAAASTSSDVKEKVEKVNDVANPNIVKENSE
jgi:hypothetical protein